LIECAAHSDALGWKINGAGGDGGSLALLSATPERKTALEEHIVRLDERYVVIPMQIAATGLQVTGSFDM
jgi:hypothetical protein